jgi:hypothetical protein
MGQDFGVSVAGQLRQEVVSSLRTSTIKLNMTQYKNPAWWTKEEDSAWERTKEAFKRDWDQTKHDLGGKQPDTNQNVTDTVKQAAGKEPIPPRGQPAYEQVEPAYRFGSVEAAGRLGRRFAREIEAARRDGEVGTQAQLVPCRVCQYERAAADWPGAFLEQAAGLHRCQMEKQNFPLALLAASLDLTSLGEPEPVESPFRRLQAAGSAAATAFRLQWKTRSPESKALSGRLGSEPSCQPMDRLP